MDFVFSLGSYESDKAAKAAERLRLLDANPFIADRLRSCFSGLGVHLPVICTPEQFFPDEDRISQDDPPDAD